MNTQQMTSEEKKISSPSIFKFLFSPSLEMEKMKQKPAIWMPLIITLLLGMISTAIYSLIPNVMRGVEEQMGVAAEGLQVFTIITGVVGSFITMPITLLISGAIMLGIAKLFKGQGTFKSYFSVSIFLMFVTNIGFLFNNVIAYLLDGKPYFTSLNGILNETGNLGGLFSSIEIFAIWTSILTGLAFYKMANLSKGISIGLGIAAFILTIVIGMLTGGMQ